MGIRIKVEGNLGEALRKAVARKGESTIADGVLVIVSPESEKEDSTDGIE